MQQHIRNWFFEAGAGFSAWLYHVQRSMRFLGLRFLLTIVAIEHVLQGFVYGGGAGGIVGLPILFLFRSYGTLSAVQIQVLRTIAVSPWAMKPLFGMVSDLVYIDGFNKLPYIGATLVLAIASCIFLVFTWPLSPEMATCLFFLLFLQIAVADLLLEAKYTDKVRDRVEVNTDLGTFVQLGMGVGQLLSLVLVGVLIAYVPLKFLYLVPIAFFALTLYYPIANNWLEDQEYELPKDNPNPNPNPNHDIDVPMEAAGGSTGTLRNLCCGRFFWYSRRDDPLDRDIPFFGFDYKKLRENWRLFAMGFVIIMIALTTNVMGLLDLPIVYLFSFSLTAAPLMIIAFFFLVDRRIAMIQTVGIIQNLCTVPLEGALFFFFTDNAEAYPTGPHFSDTFYVTGIGVTACVINIISIIIYNRYMRDWSFRNVLLVANAAFIFASLPNMALFLRWNKEWGIPDELFVLGTEAMQVIIGTWCSLPLTLMMNQLCPKGMQATSYALLAGCINLGSALSQYQGAFVLHAFGIEPRGAPHESAQFDNLWKAGLISILLPILPIVAIFFLIPDTSQSESILKQRDMMVVPEEYVGGSSGECDSDCSSTDFDYIDIVDASLSEDEMRVAEEDRRARDVLREQEINI